jgi:transcriptional regulator with XRE-family HTH domain
VEENFDIDGIRRYLADQRIRARITQDEMATILGCSRKWVSRFERSGTNPNLKNVLAYAKYFSVQLLVRFPVTDLDLERPSRSHDKVIGSQKVNA